MPEEATGYVAANGFFRAAFLPLDSDDSGVFARGSSCFPLQRVLKNGAKLFKKASLHAADPLLKIAIHHTMLAAHQDQYKVLTLTVEWTWYSAAFSHISDESAK